MSIFRGKGVRKQKTPTEVNYIVDDFLIEGTITLIYAKPGEGKSMFLLGLTKWIYENTNFHTEYYDFDNPLMSLGARGADDLCEDLRDRFDYIHPEELENTTRDTDLVVVDAKSVLGMLAKEADVTKKNYKNTLFMFDSATDFCDEGSDGSVKQFMEKLKRIRRAGGTVIFLHHTNKVNGEYKGSPVFISASDNIYKLKLDYQDETGKTYLLEWTHKRRFEVNHCAFKLSSQGFNLEILEYSEVCIPVHEQQDIRSITVTLRQNKGSMKQGDLLDKALNTTSTNKNATALLTKYEGKHWNCEKKGGSKIYSLI